MRMIIAGLLGVLMATPGGAGAQGQTHKGYESPPFQVDLAEGPAELRSCGAHLVAEVTVAGSREDSIGEGFRVLAGYIFGGNATGQKIAMTVPVAQSQQGERRWTVRLMIPQAFSSATVPAPKDGSIRFCYSAARAAGGARVLRKARGSGACSPCARVAPVGDGERADDHRRPGLLLL